MLDHLTDSGAAGGEILARIEVIGVLPEVLADAGGERKTEVRVDVDLADCHLCGLTELLLGDAYCIGHLAAELVDLVNELLGNAGGAVKNDREAGQTAGYLFKDVETERRRNELAGDRIAGALLSSELISAVAGADGDGKRVASGALNELLNVLGTGVAGILSGYVDLILNAGESAELGLNDNAVVMSVLNDLLCDLDVLLEGKTGLIDHDGAEAAVDAALAELEGITVIEVNNDRKIKTGGLLSVLNSSLDELHKIDMLCVVAGALGNLKDKRSVKLDGRLSDSLNDLHVVNVESADCVAAVVSFLEHFFGSYDSHCKHLLLAI